MALVRVSFLMEFFGFLVWSERRSLVSGYEGN